MASQFSSVWRYWSPASWRRLLTGHCPDVFIATPGNLDAEEWRVLVDLVRLIKESAPEGSKALPSDIAPALEETVRAHFARPVEAK
jgi:hypothetical protein